RGELVVDLLAQHVLELVAVPDQVRAARVDEYLGREAVAEEEPGRGGRSVGARAQDADQVAGRQLGQLRVGGDDVVGGTQRTGQPVPLGGRLAGPGKRADREG